MVKLRSFQFACLLVFATLAIGLTYPQAARAENPVASFRPISPEELKMTSDPDAPGASAIILYHDEYRDDMGRHDKGSYGADVFADYEDRIPTTVDYYRVKILTEEGRRYADVEVPIDKLEGTVVQVHGRTIKPDGTVLPFDGKIYNKIVVRNHGRRLQVTTFKLPGAEVGCILEYYYTIDLNPEWFFESNWIISDELFIKSADFSFKYLISPDFPNGVRWTWQSLPSGATQPKEGDDHIVRMHAENVLPFPSEDFMPPEDELKARVDFIYRLTDTSKDPAEFWAKIGRKWDSNVESFVGKPKSLESAVASVISPNDSPDIKLQKLYARVQQMRNTTFEPKKTEQEVKRTKETAATSAEEVWKRGYGTRKELNWLFLGLARAAGFDAHGAWVANREDYFFNPQLMEDRKLSSSIVVVELNGKKIFCNPGEAFTPYGLLPWPETSVQGLELDKKDPVWVTTLTTVPEQARTLRRAVLTLNESGDLEGKLTVTYSGLEAARLRMDQRDDDETAHQKFLEDTVKSYIPAASEVKLTSKPDWRGTESPLEAEFDLKVPGWATVAGHHFIVPAGLFSAREKHLFDHEDRIYPIYIEFPFIDSDSIDIAFPAGWQVSSFPAGHKDPGARVVSYNLSAQGSNGTLHVDRSLSVGFLLLDKKYYAALRRYFQDIKSTDDEQTVLDSAQARAEN